MSDAYSAFIDQFYPQPQQQDAGSGNPYDQMLMDYLTRTGIGMDDPMVQQIIAMSPAKYQAQNAQKQIENERDYQTGRDKYALDVMQASQGSQIDAQKMDLGERQFGLEEKEYGQKYGDVGQDAEIVFRSMDPAAIHKAFSGDFQAYGQLAQQVAHLLGDPDSGATISPRVAGVLGQMAQDDRAMSPEALATMQHTQDQEADRMTQMGEGFERFATKTPEMGQAVRDVMGQAKDPMELTNFLSGNGGSTEMAYAALDLAQRSHGNPGKYLQRKGRVGHGMPNRDTQAKQAMQAEQAKVWNAGPALNRSPEPVVQATQTWNQPGVVNPNMTPAQAFELLHSPEAALAASPNRPAPPKAKDKPKDKPKPKPKPKSNKAV